MPANCQNCFASDDECRFCRAAKKYIPMLGKPKFCPLVALPDKHGRLVDADAMLVSQEECDETSSCLKCRMHVSCCADMEEIIRNAPTIVEAEDEP